ncbi:MAG: hypothetical protein EOO43_16455 [Flavobacterium sp.]|nr:MAG: hypothetical protein EOO43_16455 [Flavobacterium sp.]
MKFIVSGIATSADNGQTTAEPRIDLSNDRWIFVSYSYMSAMDTTHAKSIVTIYVMNKEPIHQ